MDESPLATRTLQYCLACGGTALLSVPLRYDYHGTTFPLAECARCGMRFLSVQPTAEALGQLYSPEYFERDFRCGRSDVGYYDENAFRDENQGLLDAFARLTPPGQLLEVGCAGGWLLKQARERGWQVQGIELSEEAAARAQSLGLDVHTGDLSTARLSADRFDLVYMGDVLEHVPDCRATLNEVARLLKPGGWLYLRGPITTHSIARSLALAAYRLAGRDLVLHEPPYHLWEFKPRPLARLARAAGLEVRRLAQSKIPPGHAHGEKTGTQRAVMALLDGVNLAVTRLFNARGDRIVMLARKPG